MIYNFYGDNKGKTSSALGTIMRALGGDKRVRIVFFMKHWNTSENELLKKMQKVDFDVDFFLSGDKEFIWTKDVSGITLKKAQDQLEWGKVEKKDLSDIEKAKRGMYKAWRYLEEEPFLLVLDELNYALTFGLIQLTEAKELLEAANSQKTHVVITGKDLHPELKDICDLITEMKKIKHPFDKGVTAIKGLDY